MSAALVSGQHGHGVPVAILARHGAANGACSIA